jgi:hypothetical protein
VTVLGLCLAGFAGSAHAWIFTISSGTREIYLQVGAGTYNGGDFLQGGTPGANATINTVSLTVPGASVGNGVAQTMTSNSAVADSSYNDYAVCNPPTQVYIAAWSRASSNSATLTVSSPASLTSGAETIPFTQISWTSTANGDATADIAAGTFSGGSVALATIKKNTWVEDCMTFSYQNSGVAAAGTYAGEAVYTLSLP